MKLSVPLLAVAVLAAAGSAQALAADLAADAPYAAVNWAGIYFGGAGGVMNVDSRVNADIRVGPATMSVLGITSPWTIPVSSLVNIPSSYSNPSKQSLSFGAVAIGYNWQNGRHVYGVEADVTTPDSASVAGIVRARYGLAFDKWLVYGTGGLSFSEGIAAGAQTTSVSGVTWHYNGFNSIGFVAGAGVERKLTDHIVAGLEALYYGFNDTSQDVSLVYSKQIWPVNVTVPVNAAVKTGADAYSIHVRLTYQFDW
jgi:opacity protein-like surface antigen